MNTRFVIYPFLVGIYYVLSAYSNNMEEMVAPSITRPLCVTMGVTVGLWVLWWGLLRNVRKAGLITSVFLVLALTHRHLFIKALQIFDYKARIWTEVAFLEDLGAMVALVLVACLTYVILRWRGTLQAVTTFLNVASVILVIFPIYAIATQSKAAVVTLPPLASRHLPDEIVESAPHIFYIVLDGYGRDDVLQEYFHHDNGPFLDRLSEHGFYIADRSRSNYTQTSLSIASTLNVTYLDFMAPRRGAVSYDRRTLTSLSDTNRTVQFLKQYGYTFVSFASGIAVTRLREPSRMVTPPRFLTEFEHALLHNTAVPAWLRMIRALPGGWRIPDQYDLHRERIRFALDRLPSLAASKTPLFVFAHLVSPHPPFVFEEDGSRSSYLSARPFTFGDGTHAWSNRLEYVTGYRRQLAFLNKELEVVIESLLEQAARPAVIILQGDHGPGSMWHPNFLERTNVAERFAILNAFYFPDGDYSSLDDDISPVNTFQAVLNHYFGTDIPRLTDRSYYSSWFTPFRFIDVSDEVSAVLDTPRDATDSEDVSAP